MSKERGTRIDQIPCTKCSSSDGMMVYEKDDGSIDAFCFSCQSFEKDPYKDGKEVKKIKQSNSRGTLLSLETIMKYPTSPLYRGISPEVYKEYGVHYEVDTSNGEPSIRYFPYYRKGVLVGYKGKRCDKKEFFGVGDLKAPELFGQQLFSSGGKFLLITEGEDDCLSLRQVIKNHGRDYRVVSLPSGANMRGIKDNFEWIDSFDCVVLCFDQDKAGKLAARQAAEIFSPGKIKIMTLPKKDANEMLLAGETKELFNQIGRSQEYRPDGIVSGASTWERLQNRPTVNSLPYPPSWNVMNEKTYGLRVGELDTWTSGSGMGKTQLVKELEYHILKTTEESIGIIHLEEPLEDSVEGFMSLHLNKRIHLPDVKEGVGEEELYQAWLATSGTNRIHYYDHFGSVDDSNLLNKIRWFASGLDCKYIFLDHLSIVVSELAEEGNERERIDSLMTKLKRLTQELNIWIGVVVHLRKTQGGKSFEEGGVPTLDDLRGSGSIKQLSNSVYALSRDQQAEDERVRNTSLITVLKCRFTGDTGSADYLKFDIHTGRMDKVETLYQESDGDEF